MWVCLPLCALTPPLSTTLVQSPHFLEHPPIFLSSSLSPSSMSTTSSALAPGPITCSALLHFSASVALCSPPYLPPYQVCRGLAPTSPSPAASPAARLLRILAETPSADTSLPGNWQVTRDEPAGHLGP